MRLKVRGGGKVSSQGGKMDSMGLFIIKTVALANDTNQCKPIYYVFHLPSVNRYATV
jgi:hypothetical protein